MRERRSNALLYAVIAALFAALAVWGVATYEQEKDTAEAQRKADQYIAALAAEGFTPPSRDVVVSLFGEDGGALCENPDGGVLRALLATRVATGGGIASRPVIADRRVFLTEELALAVYCPDRLPEFRQFVADLKTDDTLPD